VAKLPWPPEPARLREVQTELHRVATSTLLWRLHETVGPHVLPWNALRRFGPVSHSRFDPHNLPPRRQRLGVFYVTLDVATAVAERFQVSRRVDTRHGSPHLTGWKPTRVLQLLDLTSTWPVRAGASHAINTGRRDVTRAWARAIASAWPDLDALWYASSMTGRPCLALFSPAEDAVPGVPIFSEPLAHPGMQPWLAQACREIGYQLL
jgi:hypothetical protein